jgi:hypothetical protein
VTHRLFIPRWRPATINQLLNLTHWARYRLKGSDQRIVAGYAVKAKTPMADGKRRVSLTVVMGPRRRACDPDSLWKSLLDACVACGLLVDDSREWVELGPIEQRRAAKGEQWGTWLELTDLDDAMTPP